MSNYRYIAFGLVIKSPFEIQELVKSDEESFDVEICYNKITHQLNLEKEWFNVAENILTFVVDDKIAAFRVSNGNLIEIDRYLDATEEDIRLFLLGSAFGGLLHQRGLLPLHASAVEINGKAILFFSWCLFLRSSKRNISIAF